MGDCLFFVFAGIEPFVYVPGRPFDFPALWVFVVALVLFITYGYAFGTLRGIGAKFVVESGSRLEWWAEKSFWCLAVTLLYFAVMLLEGALLALFGVVELSMDMSHEAAIIFRFEADETSEMPFMGELFLSIAFMCVALNQAQLSLSFIVGPVISFGFVLSVVFLSCFFNTPFLPGEHLMLIRSEPVVDGGTSITSGHILSAALFILFFVFGCIGFKRMNILPKEEL